jgi:hypothetical protein
VSTGFNSCTAQPLPNEELHDGSRSRLRGVGAVSAADVAHRDWLRSIHAGGQRLGLFTPGCHSIGYMDTAGCHQLVLLLQNIVVKSANPTSDSARAHAAPSSSTCEPARRRMLAKRTTTRGHTPPLLTFPVVARVSSPAAAMCVDRFTTAKLSAAAAIGRSAAGADADAECAMMQSNTAV